MQACRPLDARSYPASWVETKRALPVCALTLADILRDCVFALQLLPALYRYVGAAFHATPRQLGLLTFSRAVVQALSSPLAGLAGHWFNRQASTLAACLKFEKSTQCLMWQDNQAYAYALSCDLLRAGFTSSLLVQPSGAPAACALLPPAQYRRLCLSGQWMA